jgi:NAD(P)-dependent dehydrogenase (short-subunit alcohol dehydrogenase family)
MDRPSFDSLFSLRDRVAIITGGTRGIGLAIAEAYVLAGAKVVVASRKPDACASAAEHLCALDGAATAGRAIGVPTHVGDLEDLAALVARTVDAFGGIDIVVNDAANPLAQPLGSFTPEAFAKSFDVNVRGPVFLVQEALPHLTASEHASVIHVVSVGAFLFSAHVSMYAAGKAAMVQFTKAMAAEYAPRGIRVNALAPGAVDTHMVQNNPPEFVDVLAGAALLRRIAQPDEMVGPALLLASDAGSFITGQVLLADGGTVPH